MAVVTTSDPSKELADLQDRNTERLKQQGNGKVQIGFARDVKNSVLFQYDWGQLLSAAPLALSLMGSCYVAATSPLAQSISLKDAMPAGGFDHIRHPELKACLVQISDAGRMAFLTAEKRMGSINDTSRSLKDYMANIVKYLPELPHPSAEIALNNNIDNLNSGAKDCLKYATEIEDQFKNWLLLVCEVHRVTEAKGGITDVERYKNESQILAKALEAELTTTSLGGVKKVAQDMKKNMDMSRKLFKEAADAVPGPWESVGLSFASGMAESVTSMMAQGLPGLMAAGITGMPPGVGGILGQLLGQAKPSGAETKKDGKRKKRNGLGRPHTLPDDSDDIAYPTSVKVSPLFTALATLLGKGDADIDWDALAHKDKSDKNGLTFLRVSIQYTQTHVQWSSKSPSEELKAALTDAIDVITKLEAVTQKENQLVSTKPDSKTVKEWREKLTESRAKVTLQVTIAQSLPGSAPGSAPLMNTQPSSGVAPERSAQTSALAAAHEKMNVTQAAYLSSQGNYLTASERANKVEVELATIKANLKSLEADKVTMAKIKEILLQCIGTLIQIKAQITSLVRFFGALSAMIEHVVKEDVKSFIQNAESARTVLLGNVSLLDSHRQDLYTTSLMCQAYFSLFSTIATMYVQVSVKHIMPGVDLCDELSKSTDDPNAISRRVRELNEFSDASQRDVKDMVAKAQREITSTLDNRVRLIAEDVKMLPPLDSALTDAIAKGQKTITDAADEGLGSYRAPATVLTDTSANPDEI